MWIAIGQEMTAPPSGRASPGDVLRPGHLGRTIGDIQGMIAFYHDLLGAAFARDRSKPLNFFASEPLTDFVSSPPQAEYRAVNMPIPGTSVSPGKVPEMVVEVIEFRNIERRQYMPGLQDSGVSNLTLLLRNLDKAVEALKQANVPVITIGGKPVGVTPMPGLNGRARAIMVRDPDGYPVELAEISPTPATNAPAESNIIGAHASLVVTDMDTTLNYYRHLVGPALQTWKSPVFRKDEDYNQLRNTPGAERRVATMLIPGSGFIMELIQYRGIGSKPYRPMIQDIGVAHVAFMVKDIDLVMQRLKDLGFSTLGRNGGYYSLNPNTRALYTRDPDGFFLEIMEPKQ